MGTRKLRDCLCISVRKCIRGTQARRIAGIGSTAKLGPPLGKGHPVRCTLSLCQYSKKTCPLTATILLCCLLERGAMVHPAIQRRLRADPWVFVADTVAYVPAFWGFFGREENCVFFQRRLQMLGVAAFLDL